MKHLFTPVPPLLIPLCLMLQAVGLSAQSTPEKEKPTVLIDACFVAAGQAHPELYYLANDGEYTLLQFGEMRRGTLNPATPANPLLLYTEDPSAQEGDTSESLPKPAMSISLPQGTRQLLLLVAMNKDRSLRTLAVPDSTTTFGPTSIRAINLTDAVAFIQADEHKARLQPMQELQLAKTMPLRQDYLLTAHLKFPDGSAEQLNAGTTWFRSPKLRLTLVVAHQVQTQELRPTRHDSEDRMIEQSELREIVVPMLIRLIDRPNEPHLLVDPVAVRASNRSAAPVSANNGREES